MVLALVNPFSHLILLFPLPPVSLHNLCIQSAYTTQQTIDEWCSSTVCGYPIRLPLLPLLGHPVSRTLPPTPLKTTEQSGQRNSIVRSTFLLFRSQSHHFPTSPFPLSIFLTFFPLACPFVEQLYDGPEYCQLCVHPHQIGHQVHETQAGMRVLEFKGSFIHFH